MAIGLQFRKQSDKGAPDLWSPVAKCDVCGREISEGRSGVYVYNQSGDSFQVPTIACQGACHDKVEEEMEAKGGSPGWLEMYAFVGMLKANVMLKSNATNKKLADQAESGELTF